MQIGGALASGKPHGNRAPDYDDWELNGDLLFWDDTLDCAFELSSMGIRVSPESLDRQLTIAKCDDRRTSRSIERKHGHDHVEDRIEKYHEHTPEANDNEEL